MINPANNSVTDIKPQNNSVIDIKPTNFGILDPSKVYMDTRTFSIGQWIPLAGFLYPVGSSFVATRI